MTAPDPDDLVLEIEGSIERGDIPALREKVLEMLQNDDGGPLVCVVRKHAKPNAVTIDALAQLQLAAGRCGRRFLLVDADDELRELLRLVGLEGVIGPTALSVEIERQAEQREEPGGLEEETDPGDGPA